MAVLYWIALILGVVATTDNHVGLVEASDFGVCYGLLGNDLPAATEVVALYKQNNVTKMRLFDTNIAALQALKGSGISVTIGVKNQDLPGLASGQDAVNSWFNINVEPYLEGLELGYIAVGNEVIPGELGIYVPTVMQFLQNLLIGRSLQRIKVTTVVPATVLGSSYPPSSGAFSSETTSLMTNIVSILASTGSPLMINVYPYFAYKGDSANVRLDYAQFTATSPVVIDGALSYSNLFDAVVDSFYTAMEKVGGHDVSVVVSESGWPSDGSGQFTSVELAGTYNRNFIQHIVSRAGTPKRPGKYIEGYIFAMFNENQKPEGEEQHFGLFYPNKQPVYPLF